MKAFSMVELVLTIAILGVMALALGPGLDTAIRSYSLISSHRQTAAEIRAAIERMTREIRQIPGSAQIIDARPTSFQFQFPAGTNITYSKGGTNLMRNGDVLISGVNNLAFDYYTASGTTTNVESNIRRVQVQITMTSGLVMRTQIFLLNTSTNYSGFTQT